MGREQQDLRNAIAGLLGDNRFQGACAKRDMGALFRLLNHRGLSTRRIAAAVGITQGRLYDYMNDKSRVEKLAIFEQISDALFIPGQMLGLARRSWEPQAVESTHVPATATADRSDLAAIDAFRSADKQTGGGRLYAAAVRHLNEEVARRLVDATSGPQVFAAAAALSEMAGWMAHDSGRDGRAQQHFVRALALAHTSGTCPWQPTLRPAAATWPCKQATSPRRRTGRGPASSSPTRARASLLWQPGCTPCTRGHWPPPTSDSGRPASWIEHTRLSAPHLRQRTPGSARSMKHRSRVRVPSLARTWHGMRKHWCTLSGRWRSGNQQEHGPSR